jgi:hypothetical protein
MAQIRCLTGTLILVFMEATQLRGKDLACTVFGLYTILY